MKDQVSVRTVEFHHDKAFPLILSRVTFPVFQEHKSPYKYMTLKPV